MPEWEAPAKLNFSLELRQPDSSGYHPIRSLAQTIEWVDRLRVEVGDEDRLDFGEAELPDGASNLVWKAVAALISTRPPLDIVLDKQIAVAAGLGGGSSDAAAILMAVTDLLGLAATAPSKVADRIGADVTFFLTGGTAWMEGYGEVVNAVPGVGGFSVAVVVPPFELSTSDAYARWDRLSCPGGPGLEGASLPPTLREYGPLRNDLTPAALSLRPELGDWMVDLSTRWGRPVAISGSGPSMFAYFSDLDEAESAIDAAPTDARATKAAGLRPWGARRRIE